MTTRVIVPHRGLDAAKTRLAPVLTVAERGDLAAHLLRRVLRIALQAVPLMSGVVEYAELGFVPGGTGRNRLHFSQDGPHAVRLPGEVPQALDDVLYDPQTSGGLLLSVGPERAAALEAAFSRDKQPLWPIGEVTTGLGVDVDL